MEKAFLNSVMMFNKEKYKHTVLMKKKAQSSGTSTMQHPAQRNLKSSVSSFRPSLNVQELKS